MQKSPHALEVPQLFQFPKKPSLMHHALLHRFFLCRGTETYPLAHVRCCCWWCMVAVVYRTLETDGLVNTHTRSSNIVKIPAVQFHSARGQLCICLFGSPACEEFHSQAWPLNRSLFTFFRLSIAEQTADICGVSQESSFFGISTVSCHILR